MIQPSQNEQVKQLANKIYSKLDRYELILVPVFAASFILKIATGAPVSIFITLSLLSLAALYFLSGNADPSDTQSGGLNGFFHKLVCWGLSICTVGILFTLEHWPNARFLLLLGSIVPLGSLIAILWYRSKEPENSIFSSRYMARIIIICAIGITLLIAKMGLPG